VDPLVRAAAASWTARPEVVLPLLLAAFVYLRGFLRLRRDSPGLFPPWRALALLAGLATVFVAVSSPLDALGNLLLFVHMTQHLLLMLVAPPLLLLGAPWAPLLRGVSPWTLKHGLGPFLAWPALRRLARALTHPVACWTVFVATTWAWHVPAAYDLALRSPSWHAVEHASFLAAGLLFWWPVVQPRPSRPRWPRWFLVPYLLLASLQNTALSAILAFSDRVLYPAYAAGPRLLGLSALADQAVAGAVLWVPGSILMLAPVVGVVVGLLEPQGTRPAATRAPRPMPAGPAEPVGGRPLDLLALPAVGRALRSLAVRRTAQALLLVLAAAVVADGWWGPAVSPLNLAGVLPWTHWRGLLVIGLLAVGNVFCTACPFVLARDVGRRLLPARRAWPRRLRSKWLGVALFVVFLWAYEAFSLWDRPSWTAWIVVGYFAAALAVDGVFRGASFCKYVCPIGQFQFVSALVSPAEVRAKEPDRCRRCATFDCVRGGPRGRGCELQLFLPRKSGNLDCTFCMDCVRACPHDNVALVRVARGREVVHDRRRSSLGRLSLRPDVAAFALALVFGAFLNAAAMTAPVMAWEGALASRLGGSSHALVVTLWLLPALVLPPPLLALGCGVLGRRAGGASTPLVPLTARFALALVPLGFAMWLAHFGFHLVTGAGAALPAVARALAQAGLLAPRAASSMTMPSPVGAGLLDLELLVLDLGLLGALYLVRRVALDLAAPRPARLMAPWVALAVALWMAGVWILFQPMQMRGMVMG
jgi:cytochrome c oxidase assembly factor CtaG/polyferredoxin